MKGLFKRVDGIALSLVFFYCLIVGFVGLCLDPNSTIVMTSNPIASLATAFGFAEIESLGIPSGIMLAMILVYTFLFALAVIVEVRLAQNADEKPYSAKWLSIMAASFVVLYGLGSASAPFLTLPSTTGRISLPNPSPIRAKRCSSASSLPSSPI